MTFCKVHRIEHSGLTCYLCVEERISRVDELLPPPRAPTPPPATRGPSPLEMNVVALGKNLTLLQEQAMKFREEIRKCAEEGRAKDDLNRSLTSKLESYQRFARFAEQRNPGTVAEFKRLGPR